MISHNIPFRKKKVKQAAHRFPEHKKYDQGQAGKQGIGTAFHCLGYKLLITLIDEQSPLGATRQLAKSLMVPGNLYNRTGRLDLSEQEIAS